MASSKAEQIEARLARSRPLAHELAALVPGATIEDDVKKWNVYVRWKANDAEIRVSLGFVYLDVRVRLSRISGVFFLVFENEVDDGTTKDSWETSDRKVFVSKHGYFQSAASDEEVARLMSIPEQNRSKLVAIGEHYMRPAELREGALIVGLGQTADHKDAGLLHAYCMDIIEIARAIPETWTRATPMTLKRLQCTFCRAEGFVPEAVTTCPRCGAVSA